MTTYYVVIGTAPTVDTSVVAGPFRSPDRAEEAAGRLTELGYVTEVAACQPLDHIDPTDWSRDDR